MPFRRETWGGDLARWAYIGIVVAAACAMAVLFSLILTDRNNLRREANIRATQIQQQRYDTTFNNCVDQNDRHTAVLRRLHSILQKSIRAGVIDREQAHAQEESTVFLIDALVPKRNCAVVARRAVHPLENPKGQ
jgi:hypothetical protein